MEKKNDKILFIHGFSQSSLIFDKRTKAVTSKFRQNLNIIPIFANAPHKLSSITENDEIIDQYGWLFFDEKDKLDFKEHFKLEKTKFLGFKESEQYLLSIFETNPEISFIFAFSQGALIITLMLMQRELQQNSFLKNLKSCILVSGVGKPFPNNEEYKQWEDFYNEKIKINIPILLVFGKNDQYIENERTLALTKFYKKFEIFEHEGKHYVPSKATDIEIYINFIKKYV